MEIKEERDIILARRLARKIAKDLDFSLVNQTRIATAVSEITRNALTHGGGGVMKIKHTDNKKGLEIMISDEGNGIPDVEQAMRNGYSTKDSLGLGLGGAKRLMDEFEINSRVGKGTIVTMRKFLPRRS
ncbi:anti-sigma regulatory factor [Candidatus Bathyarchaeota archaeon]|nr:anti-sigma regulatory factor [Candidatus Bathyarchaeota archaeon]